MTEYIQVATTAGSREEAEKIATTLVQQRLAACVQISGPLTSLYRWQGKIERSEEYLCTIKSRENLFQELAGAIKAIHSYSVPEILALPILAADHDYLNWLDTELKQASG